MRVRPSILVPVVMVLLVVSVGVNVLQAQKILTLVNRSASPVSLVSKQLSAIDGKSVSGQSVSVQLKGSLPTVVYHFSTTCSWCERNWTNLEALARAAGGRYRVIVVTTEAGVRSYAEARGLDVEVVEQLDSSAVQALNLGGTPRTIAVGADGVVTHDWSGAYAGRIARQVEDLFGVDLPGLQPIDGESKEATSRPQ